MLYFALFLASVLSFGISAISGGGASLLLVPVLAQLLPAAKVPAALSIGTGASSVSRIFVFKADIRWDVTRWFVPAAVPMAVAGALLLRYLNPAYVQVVMALFLLSNVRQLVRHQAPVETEKSSNRTVLLIGAVAGFLSGLTGAVGVLFNRFYLNYGLTKQQIVATRATNEVLIHLAKLIVYFSIGLLDGSALGCGVIVAVAATLASLGLKPILARLPHAVFAKIGYAAMGVAGLALLSTSVAEVIVKDQIQLSYSPVVGGADARLHWRKSVLSLELEYDGGVEVEFPVELAELTDRQQTLVAAQNPGSDKVLVEAVYEIGQKYYEAYYLNQGRTLKKIDFTSDGQLLVEE